MRLGQARMEFTYEGSFGTQGLEPYERLMYDAMLGDRTLFTERRRHREPVGGVERAARRPAAAAPLRARLLRPAEDARADRAAALVAARDLVAYSPTATASTGRERSARRVGRASATSASSAEPPMIAANGAAGT